MACSCVDTKILQKMCEGPFWEGVWLCLEPWDSVRLSTASTYWNIAGKCGPHGELVFFFIKKEPVAVSNEVPSNLFVSAETLKACALDGLHLFGSRGEAGSRGGQSPDLGDMRRQGCPKSLEWISSCSASETSLGCEVYEHNNVCWATEVIGQDWSNEVVSLFLEDWKLGRVALPHDHGPSGMVVVGWLGRGSTTLHCTHHALPPHLRHQSFFSFANLFSPPGVRSGRAALHGCREASGSPCSQPGWSCVTLNVSVPKPGSG